MGVPYNKDYAAEKNKFLENVCEKLTEKNVLELKESVAEYCYKFLDYNKSDIENITEKYINIKYNNFFIKFSLENLSQLIYIIP
jgi:hypothetical protein